MGFSAMKLINEAGIGGAAVISVVQPSALLPVSSSDEGMGPLMRQLPWGPQSQAALPALVLFPCGRTSQSKPWFISENIPGEEKEKKKRERRKKK